MTVENGNKIDVSYGSFRGWSEDKRGLIAVWGKEAVQFLDGLITNDVKKLEDGDQILCAFPGANGRLLAVARCLRQGETFIFETEEATTETIFSSLFRFTYAGDFFVEDKSAQFMYFDVFGDLVDEKFPNAIAFHHLYGAGQFVPVASADEFRELLLAQGFQQISAEHYETLRIEHGIPKFGVDMDAATIVPEVDPGSMISYNKGCYIGQEIIARIHFRGHVAKKLTGLTVDGTELPDISSPENAEIVSTDGRPAGRVTSITFSQRLGKIVALASIRYEFLPAGTTLKLGDRNAVVTDLPFIAR